MVAPMEVDTPEEFLSILIKRRSILEKFSEGTTDKRVLESELNISRPTIHRAFRDLEDFGIISSVGSKYELTLFGKYVFSELTDARASIETLIKSKTLIDQLPLESGIPVRVFKEGEIRIPDPMAPIEPFRVIRNLLKECDNFVALLPILKPEYVRMFQEEIVDQGKLGEIILRGEVVEAFSTHYKDSFRSLLESTKCSLMTTEVEIPYGFVLMDKSVLWMEFHGAAGGLVGAIINQTDFAVDWAEQHYEFYRDASAQAIVRGVMGPKNQYNRPKEDKPDCQIA